MRWLIALFVLFAVVFPKGGIKLGSVPITWGYLLIALYAAMRFPAFLYRYRFAALPLCRWVTLLALVPFQLIILCSLFGMGFTDTGFALSLVSGFFVLPWILLYIFADWIETLDLAYAMRWARRGIFAVAVYGVILFAVKLGTGKFIEVPYLTVNAGDVGQLEDKNNDRGFAFKLISTYNNGNVYGASVLMLLPLYTAIERSRWRVNVVRLSLILTLSRTAWIGLLVAVLLDIFYVHGPPLASVKVLKVSRTWIRRARPAFALIALVLIIIIIGSIASGLGVSFLFDKTLGGRSDQLQWATNLSLLPSVSFESLTEVVYLSALHQFGLFGLLSFIVALVCPVLLALTGNVPDAHTVYKRSIAAGLMVYLVIAASDAAMLFIPVLLFYWSLSSLLLSAQTLADPVRQSSSRLLSRAAV